MGALGNAQKTEAAVEKGAPSCPFSGGFRGYFDAPVTKMPRRMHWVLCVLLVVCVAVVITYRGYTSVYDAKWRSATEHKGREMMIGYATAPFQNERPASQAHSTMWADFVKQKRPPGMDASPNHADLETFTRDIERAKRDVPELNAFRFGVDWARVEPREGEMARVCHVRGIRPVVTLHHFVEPEWHTARGSFAREESIATFARLARQCACALGAFNPVFVTLNEPFLYAMHGYGLGIRPPFVRSVATCLEVMCNLIRAHDAAYDELSAFGPVTIAKNFMPVFPRTTLSPVEVVLAHELHGLVNAAYLEWVKTKTLSVRFGPLGRCVRTRNTIDVLGVNHYTAATVRWTGLDVQLDLYGTYDAGSAQMCAANWRLDARALRSTLNMIDATLEGKLPVLFTELGAPQVEGDKNARVRYMRDCFAVLSEYAATTNNLCGVLAWTLVDNFEWELGTSARFGHYTLARRKTALLRTYARFARDIFSHNSKMGSDNAT